MSVIKVYKKAPNETAKLNMRLILLFLLLPIISQAQNNSEQAYQEQYAINIAQESLNGVYIPADVTEAMTELDRLSDDAGRSKLLETDEQHAADVLVMGLGKWMIVNWNFYEGSRLSHKLKEYGVTHPDDMAKFLIVSYHRHLRDVPQELEERGVTYYEIRKKEQEKRIAKSKGGR